MKVFVYGSLKKGHSNHSLIQSSEFICEAITIDRNYDMLSLGSFPAMVNGGNYDICGEVYNISKETLTYLDELESNGSFYIREKIGVAPIDANTDAWFYAWVYILKYNYWGDSKAVPCDGWNTKSWGG